MTGFEIREQISLMNEGQKIFGLLHLPNEIKKTPVVMFCHGLAGHHIGRNRVYVLLAEELSKIGIGSLRIDFRGSGDSEGEFRNMRLNDEVSDTLVALRFLSQEERIDTQRIGIFGRSFGGTIAVLAASQFNQVRSVAAWAPVFSGRQWEEQWKMLKNSALSDERKRELMTINEQQPSLDFFQDLFNLKIEEHLQALNHIPFLHIHGEKDSTVNIDHADQYVNHRKGAESENIFIRLPNSDHDLTHPEEKKLAISETVHWFKRTLRDSLIE